MIKLIKNELMKLFSAKSMYIFYACIIGLCVVVGFSYKIMGDKSGMFADLASQLPNLETTGQSFPILMLDSVAGFLIPLASLILLGYMISEEYGQGTLKLFLIHPVKRSQLLGAKIITLAIAIISMLLFTYVLSYITGTILFGFGDEFVFVNAMQVKFTAVTSEGIMMTLKSYLITAMALIAFVSLIIPFSLKAKSSGITVGVGVGVLIIFQILMTLPIGINKYFITGYIKGHNAVITGNHAGSMIIVLAILLVYILIPFFIGCSKFKKKDILM